MALQAALDGVGVAMGLRPYVVDDLAAKRLVRPFKLAVPKRRAWYIAYRRERAEEAGLVAFRGWLHDVARRT
jgi:DNA-binding transcriptional LysR family regulator